MSDYERLNHSRIFRAATDGFLLSHAYVEGIYLFPEDGSICLLNIDFRHPHRVFVHHHGKVEEVTLAPKEFRFLVAPPKPPKTR